MKIGVTILWAIITMTSIITFLLTLFDVKPSKDREITMKITFFLMIIGILTLITLFN